MKKRYLLGDYPGSKAHVLLVVVLVGSIKGILNSVCVKNINASFFFLGDLTYHNSFVWVSRNN